MSYLTRLYDVFGEQTDQVEEAEIIRRQLSEMLNKEQRKLLLAYGDELYASCERYTLKSFIAGFRLAAGIAAELMQAEQRDDTLLYDSVKKDGAAIEKQ